MITMNRATKKLYYEDLYLYQCRAKVVNIGDNYIETDVTIAYPEGGGQESDIGIITLDNGESIKFIHVSKEISIDTSDRESVLLFETGGIIKHYIDPSDIEILRKVQCESDVIISIDITRRALLSISHTASHLLYIAIGEVRPGILKNVIGCHIKTDYARFDIFTGERFEQEEIDAISSISNSMVYRNSGVSLYAHKSSSDYRIWECESHIIPCGGTHVCSTGIVGNMTIKRRGIGKNKDRISCAFNYLKTEEEKYHE